MPQRLQILFYLPNRRKKEDTTVFTSTYPKKSAQKQVLRIIILTVEINSWPNFTRTATWEFYARILHFETVLFFSDAPFKNWILDLAKYNQKVTVHLMSGTALVDYGIKSVSDTYIMVLGPETEADEMKQMVFIHAIERIEPMEGPSTTQRPSRKSQYDPSFGWRKKFRFKLCNFLIIS